MTGEYLTSLTPEHKKFLEDLFKDGVSFDPKVLRVYASDASLLTGTVLAMVRPENTGQLCEFMRWANEQRVAVHPRGRGTSLSGGCVPTVPGIVVSMLGMDKILEISKQDFVAVVEPGVNTAQLQAECEKLGMFYPPDPASGKATSIGGNVITCAGGLRAVKYGVTRDYVLGVEAVLPGGQLMKFGGRTHKDVIGLDLGRLFVGSEGSLGIVTKLILKLLAQARGLGIGACGVSLSGCGPGLHGQGFCRRHFALRRGIYERNSAGNPHQNRRSAVARQRKVVAAVSGGRQQGHSAAGKRPSCQPA